MTGLTGALLVGGASKRFGSPKALAGFRGETLAARGRRLLAEACDEVVVVGKGADGLPFEVLDDGARSRAPVHGLVAALRRARHDVVLALPVDVPLVTPGALRALGEARRSPVTRGSRCRVRIRDRSCRSSSAAWRQDELSLRGVNPTTLALPDRLLVDVDTPDALRELERPGHVLVVGGTGMLVAATLVARAPRARSDSCRAPTRFHWHRARHLSGWTTATPTRSQRSSLWRSRSAARSSSRSAGSIPTLPPRRPSSLALSRPAHGSCRSSERGVWPLDDVPLHVAYRQVLLGSQDGRWLTHEEISAGVVAAVDADLPLTVVGEREEH